MFTLTARCENLIRGNPDLDDTTARLQAYEQAGVGENAVILGVGRCLAIPFGVVFEVVGKGEWKVLVHGVWRVRSLGCQRGLQACAAVEVEGGVAKAVIEHQH